MDDGRAHRGRGRPTDRTAEETREAILAAAQRLFGTHGYRGVSMDAIAAAVGVNSRAIYYHFRSKRGLFDAASAEAFGRFGQEVVAQVFAHEDLRGRLGGYLDVFRTVHRERPDLVPFLGVVLVDAIAEGRPADEDRSASGDLLRQLLEAVVDDAIARGEVHPSLDRDGAVRLLVAMGMGLSMASLDDTHAFPAALDALEMLVDGTLLR